jgi:hypothetical protein
MVSLKSLTASSMSSVVLREMLRVRRSVIKRRNKSQILRRLLKRDGCSGGTACVVRSTTTGEWPDNRSRLAFAAAEFGGISFDTKVQKVGQFISVRGPVGGFARREVA